MQTCQFDHPICHADASMNMSKNFLLLNYIFATHSCWWSYAISSYLKLIGHQLDNFIESTAHYSVHFVRNFFVNLALRASKDHKWFRPNFSDQKTLQIISFEIVNLSIFQRIFRGWNFAISVGFSVPQTFSEWRVSLK